MLDCFLLWASIGPTLRSSLADIYMLRSTCEENAQSRQSSNDPLAGKCQYNHVCLHDFDSMVLFAYQVFDTAFEAHDVARLPEIVTITAPMWRSTQSRRQAIASSLS